MADFPGNPINETVLQGPGNSVPGLLIGGGAAGVTVFVNRVFDNVAGGLVFWRTDGAEDITTGASYPGPGTFDPTEGGNDTESHVIQTILEP